ncbi:fructose PTS transporter subunit IIA, partial [Corynebacterium sp.]|uniref:fructose PTS transporter subunit IIA n=1 Tax=Corynebacterium sp. TaxID=1720 RepID=UPI0026E03B05
MSVISADLVRLDVDLGADTTDVITALAQVVHAAGRAKDATRLADAALERESQNPTGVPGRVAIPHCRSAAVSSPTLAFARLARPVDFGGPDGDAELVFLIAAPEGGGKAHLKILSKLARALVRGDFRERLRTARTPEEVTAAVDEVIGDIPATTTPPAKAKATIVAVTACPTGIAHTYMAADSLTQTA